MLSAPRTVAVLHALADGPKRQMVLRHAAGLPAQSTLRAQLKRLREIGAVEKRQRDRFPGALEYELTDIGRELLFVLETLERWLAASPDGPVALDSGAGRAAVRALTEAWSTAMLRALSAAPLSLTELDRIITPLSYPSLDRRLTALRLSGLVKARPGDGDTGTPYGVTPWLREGLAPLIAAADWERRHAVERGNPFGRLETETAFLLAAPLLCLPAELAGSSRMAAEMKSGNDHLLAGVELVFRKGLVVSCSTELCGDPNAWLHGAPGAWLSAISGRDTDRLELGGDRDLARMLLDQLHRTLFRTGQPVSLDS